MVAITSVGAPSVPPLAIPPAAEKPAAATDKTTSPETKPAAAPASITPYGRNRDRFVELVNTVVNADGKVGIDDQVKAYTAFWKLWGTEDLSGTDTENAEFSALFDKIDNCDFSRRASQVGNRVGNFVISAHDQGEKVGFAYLKIFATLSEEDQKIFYASQDGINYSGKHIYGDFDTFRNSLVKFVIQDSEYKNSNPDLASALKGVDSAQAGVGWSVKVLAACNGQALGNTDSANAKPKSGVDVQNAADQSASADMADAVKILSESKSNWDKQVLSLFKDLGETDPKAKDDKANDEKDRPRPSWLTSLPESYQPGYLMDKVT
jgi:hypothetical protein